MKYSVKLIFKIIVFCFCFFSNSIAISKNYDFLCSGELTTTKGRVVKKNQISQQIILKNNRLFIPGMVLLCNEKYYVFNCLKKRLDSIWQAKLDILKKKIWYQSKNVSLNKNQVFVGTCEKKNTK